jgi:hypothetical protein
VALLRALLIISVGIRRDVWSFVVMWRVECPRLICFVSSRGDVWSFVVLWGVACPMLIYFVSSRGDVWSFVILWGVACPVLIYFVSSRGDVWSFVVLWGMECLLLICFVNSKGDVWSFVVLWGVASPLFCFVSSRRYVCVYDFTVSWFVPCHYWSIALTERLNECQGIRKMYTHTTQEVLAGLLTTLFVDC